MKTPATILLILTLCACGGDDDAASGSGGAAGTAGTGGAGGAAGTAGSGGDGGAAGTAGTSGTGGAAGSGGDGGAAGAAGSGGAGGAAGAAGSGGDPCDDVTCGDHAACVSDGTTGNCVCDDGYTDDAGDCVDLDECAASVDDCPNNATCVNLEGSYRCDCDLRGTYAGVLYTDVSWAGAGSGLILDGRAILPSFELRRITAQDNGELTITVTACGGATADFCIDPRFVLPDVPTDPFPSYAYGQDFPRSLWGKLDSAVATVPMPVVAVNEPFQTGDIAAFLGLTLSGDPLQDWPASRTDPAITWVDDDDDGTPGVTSMARHVDRNGDPEYDDVGESLECAAAFPPSDPNYPIEELGGASVTWPYDYWIGGPNLKVKAFHTGARTVSRFDGAITSCDTIEGDLIVTQLNARLHGCVTENDEPCSAGVVDTLDSAPDPNTIEDGCFKFVRVADNATCDDVRAQAFELLVNGRCPVSN